MVLLEKLGYRRLDLPEGWNVAVRITEKEIQLLKDELEQKTKNEQRN